MAGRSPARGPRSCIRWAASASPRTTWGGPAARPTSTGSGTMFNLGFIYENTLSNIQGEARGRLPELTFSVFGLLADASLDLPAAPTTAAIELTAKEHQTVQVRRGRDAQVETVVRLHAPRSTPSTTTWTTPAYVFAAVTPRVIVLVAFPLERAHLPAVLAILLRRQDGARRAVAVGPGPGGRQPRPAAGPVRGHEARRERHQAAGRHRVLTKRRPLRQSPS